MSNSAPQRAPIVLFGYRRPYHLDFAAKALLNNEEAKQSDLIVYLDGPRVSSDEKQCNETFQVAKSISGFKSVEVIRSKHNRGLSGSIVRGIDQVVCRYNRLIVVEDDIVVSPYFLKYMNEGLEIYEGNDKVASIQGYSHPVGIDLPETFFMRGGGCWGWATWSRAWKLTEFDAIILMYRLNRYNLLREFDFDDSYPYAKMLEDRIAKKNDSWAIFWHASMFLKEMYSLYPGKSHVNNIGFDGTGEHCCVDDKMYVKMATVPTNIIMSCVKEDLNVRAAHIQYFRGLRNETTVLGSIIRVIKSLKKAKRL